MKPMGGNKKQLSIIKAKTINGISTLLIREASMKVISFFGQFFLIRLLFPSYFGLFAILVFIESTGELFTDIGFSQAIIQKKKQLEQFELSSIFWTRLLLSFFIFLMVFFLSPFIIPLFFHGINQGVLMLRVLSVIMLLKPYRTTITAILERNLTYNLISIMDLFGIILYYSVSITFALLGFNAWSFVIATVVKEAGETLMSIYFTKWRPDFSSSFQSIKRILSFGSYIQIGAIFSYFNQSTIPIIAGKFSGLQSVGFLNFGVNVMLPATVIVDNFGRVAFASFSKFQNDIKLLERSVEKSISMLNIIFFLFLVLMLGFSKDIVYFLFTDKWLPAVPALYWFVAGVYFFGWNVAVANMFMALGKSKEMFYTGLFSVLLQWIVSISLIFFVGFVSVAIGFFVGVVITFLGYKYFLLKNNFLVNFWNSYKLTSLTLVITLIFTYTLTNLHVHTFLWLFIKIILTILVYLIVSLLFIKKDLMQIIGMLFSFLKGRN